VRPCWRSTESGDMGRGIVCLHDEQGTEWWGEWSTVVDALVYGLSDEALLRRHLRDEYGRDGMRDIDARLARAREHGSSFVDCRFDVSGNRAGPDESELTEAELIAAFRWPDGTHWAVRA